MWCMLNSLHFHAWHSVCVLSVRLLWSGESYLFPFLFVDVLKFTPDKLQFFFFSKSNFVKLQMLWISWKCDAICTIAFPCMTFYVCITCELICSAGRACALLPQSYPFLFQKRKLCIVNAIEFLHRWCYGFSNGILTHVQHGNAYLICYAAWVFSGNM